MKNSKHLDRRKEYGKQLNLWILALGMALAVILAYRPVLAGQDGLGSVFGGLFASEAHGRTNVVAGPELVEVLESAPDGDVRFVKVGTLEDGTSPVTYKVQPGDTFNIGTRRCRTFVMHLATEKFSNESFRIACKGIDGNWRVAATPQREGAN